MNGHAQPTLFQFPSATPEPCEMLELPQQSWNFAFTGTHVIRVIEDFDTEEDPFTVVLDTATLPKQVAAGSPASVTVTIDDHASAAAPGSTPANFTVTPKVRYLELT